MAPYSTAAFSRWNASTVLGFLLAWGSAVSCVAASQSLSNAQARHLLVRTGFAPTQTEVNQLVGLRAEQAVDTLLNEGGE